MAPTLNERERAGGEEKMECQQVIELLYRFIDGRTSRKESAYIRKHLDLCLRCAREYHLERQLTEKLGNGSLWEEPPDGLYEAVKSRLSAEKVEKPAYHILPDFFRWQTLAPIAALLLLALGITIYQTNGGMNSEGLIAHVINDHRNLSAKGEKFLPIPVSTAKMAMEQIGSGRISVAENPGGGIKVVGGRFCAIGEEGKTPMIAYEVAGREVSLHVFRPPVRGLKGWSVVSTPLGKGYVMADERYRALLIETDGALSLLVSELSQAQLVQLAPVLVKTS